MFEEVSKGSGNVLVHLALSSDQELASVKLSALQSDVHRNEQHQTECELYCFVFGRPCKC
jgi:hypothetical protein